MPAYRHLLGYDNPPPATLPFWEGERTGFVQRLLPRDLEMAIKQAMGPRQALESRVVGDLAGLHSTPAT